MGEVAAAHAEAIERNMRNAGIRLSSEDVKAIQTIENHRKRFQDMYRELDSYEKGFDRNKNTARVSEIRKQKEAMRAIGRQLPSADATVGGYYLEVRRYLSGPSAKHAERMREIEAALKRYATEISAKTGVAAIPVPTAPVQGRFDDYVLTVLSLGGQDQMEFCVNGVKVTSARQTVQLKGNQVVTVRATVLDARRKQARSFQASGLSELLEQTDYRLKYRVQSGDFKGVTLWTPMEEKYTWTFLQTPNTNARYVEMSSSHDFALEDDVMAFRYNGNFTAGLSAVARIVWKGESELPGGLRTNESRGNGRGAITFNVGPG